jgi:hypothetical protein
MTRREWIVVGACGALVTLAFVVVIVKGLLM